MKKLILTILLISTPILAQVNIETKRNKTSIPGSSYHKLTNSFSSKSGNSDSFTLDATYRLDHYLKTDKILFLVDYENEETNDQKTTNKHFFHLRYTHPTTKKRAIEGFLQQEFDEFTNLKSRQLLGSSLRIQLPSKINKLSLHAGLGLMIEYESTKSPNKELTQPRSSNYISYNYTPTQEITLTGTTYIQPSLRKSKDIRILSETTLDIAFSKTLSLNTTFKYRYDNDPLPTIKKTDTTLTQGLSLRF